MCRLCSYKSAFKFNLNFIIHGNLGSLNLGYFDFWGDMKSETCIKHMFLISCYPWIDRCVYLFCAKLYCMCLGEGIFPG